MPGETALAKVSKYDFFAILGSGSYVVGCCGLLFAAASSHRQDFTGAGALQCLNDTFEGHWPAAVAALFLAFLIGNVLRALPVTRVDEWWKKWWFDGLRKRFENPSKTMSPYESALRKGLFPYPDMILGELEAMNHSILVGHPSVYKEIAQELEFARSTKLPEVKIGEIWHSAYNCWKAELCRESATAFEYTQELEGRVRLFATMICAALLGLPTGLIGFFLSVFPFTGSGWVAVMLIMVILSALISFIFGSYLRRVRGQEVAAVFTAYVSLTLKRSRERASQNEPQTRQTQA